MPLRVFLKPYALTPTYRATNKFTVKYFLNLVLVDEEDRRCRVTLALVYVCACWRFWRRGGWTGRCLVCVCAFFSFWRRGRGGTQEVFVCVCVFLRP